MSKYNVGLKKKHFFCKTFQNLNFMGTWCINSEKKMIKMIFLIIIIVRYKMIGYKIDALRQTPCLVVNPINVNSYAYLFNCTTVGRASD